MQLSLEFTPGRLVMGAIVLFVAGGIGVEAGRIWLADTWARSNAPESWERAAELEPGNAGHWFQLGKYRQWDFENADLVRALIYFERAVRANPTSPFHRMDLASAYEMRGESARAREMYEQAKHLYPISSEVAWNYGNFLLRAGEPTRAYAEIRRALETDPKLTTLAVSVCFRSGAAAEQILNEALPVRGRAYLDALDFFLAEQSTDAALQAWRRLVELSEPLELKRSFALIEALLRAGRILEARQVWEQALAASRWQPDGRAAESLVWDGGFEQDFLNGGLAWRSATREGVQFEFDASERRSGGRALRVTLLGQSNLSLAQPEQFIAVEPRTRYRFAAFLRLEDVTTDSGLRFRVFDARNPREILAITENLTGTQPWTLQEAIFATGPEARLLCVQLHRAPSAKLDNKIRGTVWVDDVSLSRMAPAEGRSKP